jgi:acyl carrier protein
MEPRKQRACTLPIRLASWERENPLNKEDLAQTIYEAMEELNEQLSEESNLPKEHETVLFGEDGLLDSMGIINLLVILEEKLESSLKISVGLTSDSEILAQPERRWTVAELSTHIGELMD